MKVMRISDFLKCGRIMKHEDADAAGLLVERMDGMIVLFVSHTWLQRALPDSPDHTKYHVLQGILQSAVADSVAVPPYWLAELQQTATPIELHSLAHGYIWMDYFSVPQEDPAQQMNAISSIVTYIDEADLFFILTPAAQHWTGRAHDLSLWKSRGWCRVERLANELSVKRKQAVVMESRSSLYVSFSHEWLNEPVGTGNFTVDADKEVVGEVVHLLLQRAEAMALESGNVGRYRQLHCMMLSLLKGLPVCEVLGHKVRSEGFDEWMKSMLFESPTHNEESGWSPLRYAAYQGRLDIARELLARGADVEAPLAEVDSTFGDHLQGCTILHGAAYFCDNPETISLLIEHKADVRSRQGHGVTAILSAAYGNRIENFQKLAEAAPDLCTLRDEFGVTPIHATASHSSLELFTFAHECSVRFAGFDPQIQLLTGAGVVTSAVVRDCRPDVLQKAISLGYDLDFSGSIHASAMPLITSCSQAAEAAENPTRLQEFWGNAEGTSALMFAALLGKVLAVRVLIDARAMLDKRSRLGRTALCFASMAGHAEIVRMLLEAGASTDSVDARGRTAAEWAQVRKHQDVVELLGQKAGNTKADGRIWL